MLANDGWNLSLLQDSGSSEGSITEARGVGFWTRVTGGNVRTRGAETAVVVSDSTSAPSASDAAGKGFSFGF